MIKIEGNAKINLTLDILGKRPDGYHEVAMVMQSIGLHDTIEMEKSAAGIALTINVPWLRADEKNLAWRAAAPRMGRRHAKRSLCAVPRHAQSSSPSITTTFPFLRPLST